MTLRQSTLRQSTVKVGSVRARSVAVLPVVAMAMLSLTGCDSKIGAAAVVNGTKISETNLTRALLTSAKAPTQARGLALGFLIRDQLFSVALERHGGVPSDGELGSYHDTALSLLLQSQTGQPITDKDVQDALSASGLKPAFATTVTHSGELEVALVKKLGATDVSALLQEINKQRISVSVNPRIGSWDASQLGIREFGKAQLPSGVEIGAVLPGDQPPPSK